MRSDALLNRRKFLHTGTAAGVALWSGVVSYVTGAGSFQKSRPDAIVYEGTYPGWPWVVRDGRGVLHCVFREGTEHMYSASGRVMHTKSFDSGLTWSPAQVIVDMPEVDDRNVAIEEIDPGTLLVSYNTYTQDRISEAMTVVSRDSGETWGEPKSVGVPNTRTRASVQVLSNNALLLPLYLDPGDAAVAALSENRGESWEAVTIPNSAGCIGDEWDLLEMEPGTLVGISRNNIGGYDGYFWQTKSMDFGKTWSPLVKTNIQSRNHPAPSQLFLQDGVPTMIYPDRRMVSVSAVRSFDPNLIEWDIENSLPLYRYNEDESKIPDGSYAVSAPLGENRRLVVDYEIREGSKRIAGYFVEFPENWGAR